MFITNSAKLPLVVNNEPLILNAALPLLQDNRMQSASLAEVWQKLWRNKWWVILTFSGMVLLTAYITFNIQPIYRAAATLQIEKEGAKVVNYGNVTPISTDMGEQDPFFRTQYEQLKSRKLAEKVINDLDLKTRLFDRPPPKTLGHSVVTAIKQLLSKFLNLFKSKEVHQAPEQPQDDVTKFLKNLYVEPIEKTHLVKVFYESPDPVLSAQILNTLIDTFIKQNLSTQTETDTYAKDFLEDEMEKARDRLTMQEAKLVEYAKQNGILEVNNSQATQERKLGELYTSLGEAERNRIQAESQYIQAQRGNVREVLNNSVVASLKQNLATLEAEYREKSQLFKPAYPDMMRLQEQIQALRGQLSTEQGNVHQSLEADFKAAKKLEDDLKREVAAYKGELVNLRDKSIEYNALKREVETSRNLYDGLLQRLKEVNVASNANTSNIKVVDTAVAPTTIFKPNKALNLVLGSLLGLMLGTALALLRDSFNQNINNVAELQQLSGLPVLGTIPAAHGMSERKLATVAANDLGSSLAEAYRVTAANLRFVLPEGVPKVTLVTSVNPAEGKSTTAVNIALSQAQMGMKVLLIDADLRRPTLHGKLGLSNQKGLSNFLVGQMEITQVTQAVREAKGLYVITAGNLAVDPVRMLSSEAMARMLKLAEQHFDSVIIDAPPVTGFAETLYIASLAEATVLVTDENRMHRKRTLKAIEQLRRIKQNLVGFIMVRSEQEALDERYYQRYRKPRSMPNVNANPDNDLFQHGVRVKRKGLNLASAA